jgi:hypothetical protein
MPGDVTVKLKQIFENNNNIYIMTNNYVNTSNSYVPKHRVDRV